MEQLKFQSNSPEETREIAKNLAEKAKPGQVFTLSGDLGVGKTAFTKGFALGLGITEPVVSPTFTIVQNYTEGRMPMYHFDTYRIEDIDEMYEIGFEDCFYGEGVSLIEWPEMISELVPENHVAVKISKNLAKGVDYRDIEVVFND